MKKVQSNKYKKYYYNIFTNLYNEEFVHLGKRWMERIESGHYSWKTMRKICIVIKWFYDNFDKIQYRLSLWAVGNAVISAYIYEKEENKLIKCVEFGTKNKLYIPKLGIEDGEYDNICQYDYIE